MFTNPLEVLKTLYARSTKVLILPPFDLSGEMDFILNFIGPLHKPRHMKADDLESPLRFDQLHFKIKLESTKVGDKVFVTEWMHRVQTKVFRDADG